jgi:hypothetical protein
MQDMVDGTLLSAGKMIKEYKIKDFSEVHVEFLEMGGRFSLIPMDTIVKMKEQFNAMILRAGHGCGREVCHFKYCANNPCISRL